MYYITQSVCAAQLSCDSDNASPLSSSLEVYLCESAMLTAWQISSRKSVGEGQAIH